jgi:hypothetical protein
MREPESDRETFLAMRIDEKGKAIVEGGAEWSDGILKFSHPYESLTERERAFVDERITEWKYRVINRNN